MELEKSGEGALDLGFLGSNVRWLEAAILWRQFALLKHFIRCYFLSLATEIFFCRFFCVSKVSVYE